jgi:hypothetical protein
VSDLTNPLDFETITSFFLYGTPTLPPQIFDRIRPANADPVSVNIDAPSFDAANGKEIWRQQVPAPARGAPTVADGRVFAVTVENQLQVLSTTDGHRLWTHSGLPETAGLLCEDFDLPGMPIRMMLRKGKHPFVEA